LPTDEVGNFAGRYGAEEALPGLLATARAGPLSLIHNRSLCGLAL
jgi:hypothetical protein